MKMVNFSSPANGTTLNLGKVTGDDAKDGQDGLTPYIGRMVTGGSVKKIPGTG